MGSTIEEYGFFFGVFGGGFGGSAGSGGLVSWGDTWSLVDGLLFLEMGLKRRLGKGSFEEKWRDWWAMEVAAVAAGERREAEAMKVYPFERGK